MTQRFSRVHRTGFSRAQVVAICALATGPKTARQIAGGRGAGWAGHRHAALASLQRLRHRHRRHRQSAQKRSAP